jgi:hypothetical protein
VVDRLVGLVGLASVSSGAEGQGGAVKKFGGGAGLGGAARCTCGLVKGLLLNLQALQGREILSPRGALISDGSVKGILFLLQGTAQRWMVGGVGICT